MLEYIQSPEFQQLLAANPEILFALFVISCVTLVCCFGFFPRWFTVTNEHHHHHYHSAPTSPSAPPQRNPLADLRPGYYYLDEAGRVRAVQVEQQQSPNSIFDEFASFVGRQPAAPVNPATYPPSKTRKSRPKMSTSKRLRIMRRDGFRCKLCGRKPEDEEGLVLHIDHRIPFSKGGTDEDENLWTLCSECNGGKSDTIMDEIFDSIPDTKEAETSPEPGGEG